MWRKEGATQTQANTELARRRLVAGWVAREIMPHEKRIRAWFGRARLAPEDIDELMQEAYCQIATLQSVEHIERPQAYFFSIARNLLLRRIKRQQIVPIEAISEIETLRDEETPSPEEQAASRMSYERVLGMIAALPERCRKIVELRKLEGWSQKEIAHHMGMSEKAVEKQVWVGVRAVRDAFAQAEAQSETRMAALERKVGRPW